MSPFRRRSRQPAIDPTSVVPVEQQAANYLRRTGRSNIRFGVVLVIASIGIALASLIGGLHERSLTQSVPGWDTTTGHIVQVSSLGCRDGCEWQVVVAFSSPSGLVKFEPPNTTTQPAIGESVLVTYPPSDPSSAHDLSDKQSDSTALKLPPVPAAQPR